jgi:hypothetical protein
LIQQQPKEALNPYLLSSMIANGEQQMDVINDRGQI